MVHCGVVWYAALWSCVAVWLYVLIFQCDSAVWCTLIRCDIVAQCDGVVWSTLIRCDIVGQCDGVVRFWWCRVVRFCIVGTVWL